jgi:hypothetical protein
MDTSNMDTSNMDTSNIIVQKCCILKENISLKNTIQQQSNEIGKIIQERDEYKILYEELLLFMNSSNII